MQIATVCPGGCLDRISRLNAQNYADDGHKGSLSRVITCRASRDYPLANFPWETNVAAFVVACKKSPNKLSQADIKEKEEEEEENVELLPSRHIIELRGIVDAPRDSARQPILITAFCTSRRAAARPSRIGFIHGRCAMEARDTARVRESMRKYL